MTRWDMILAEKDDYRSHMAKDKVKRSGPVLHLKIFRKEKSFISIYCVNKLPNRVAPFYRRGERYGKINNKDRWRSLY